MRRVIFSLVLAVFCLCTGTSAVYAAETNSANKLNVVFVIDGSGSMRNTDSEGWRYEALDLFLGLATNSGNHMGAVVFDEDIMLQQNMTEIDGQESKVFISKYIRSVELRGDTDIGKALELATQILDQSRNPSLPSAIILLSDGNTDIPDERGEEGMEASLQSKANAIEKARQEGYEIHCVCLNANNQANPAELEEIAGATGGAFMEVHEAEDLKEVFSYFYSLIYSSETVTLADEVIPENGILSIPFTIPVLGVEEANIIIRTVNENSSYLLYRPSGLSFTDDELSEYRIEARTFSIIKIPDPESGDWRLDVRGIPGDDVQIDMIFNPDFELKLSISQAEGLHLGDSVRFTGELEESGSILEDRSLYEGFDAVLVREDTVSGEYTEYAFPVSDSAGGYELELGIEEYGNWNYYARVFIEGMVGQSDAITVTVENTPPLIQTYKIKKIYVRPFMDDIVHIELNGLITDREDSVLDWSITAMDNEIPAAEIKDETLILNIQKMKRGWLTVQATDSQGLSNSIRIEFRVINIVQVAAGILIGIILLCFIVIMIRRMKQNRKHYQGEILVYGFDNNNAVYHAPDTGMPSRGKEMFKSANMFYGTDTFGLKMDKAYFVPEDENTIYLYVPNGCFSQVCDGDEQDRVKKIRLDDGMEVTLSPEGDCQRGIRVVYKKLY